MIKERIQDSSLDGFSALDGWLDGWETAYAIKERQKVGDSSKELITSLMKRL